MNEIVHIKVSDLALNEGQIPGLPSNPRQWTKEDLCKMCNSLQETPELFDMRPCIVVPNGGKYVILGGNLRYSGARRLGWKEVPCIVIDEDTAIQKMKEIVIKDNGSFGAWDFDMLANEWDDNPLPEWGVPAWSASEEAQQDEQKQAKEDEFDEDEAKIEVRCKPGDVWQLGDHRLMCGDSINLEDVKKLMGGGIS